MKRVIIFIAILAMSGLTWAHPHKDVAESEAKKTERSWPYFGKQKNDEKAAQDSKTLSASDFTARIERRIAKHSDKIEKSFKDAEAKNDFIGKDRKIQNANDLRDAARAIEDLISESGVISSFADMMLDLAEDFDVEATDDGLSLKFDGDRIGRVKVKRDKHSESSLDVEGFGRNMTIEKEVIKRDGKTKTRIVIEVDGDEEFDIDFKPKR
jgi:hypothetical protein